MPCVLSLRRSGLVIAALGVAAFAILLLVEPVPGTLVGESPGRASVGKPSAMHYDAANDTTFAAYGYCNHVPCGAAIALHGNRTAELQAGPWLVEPETGKSFSRTRMDAIPDARAPPGEVPPAGAFVYLPAAELRPLWPPYIGYLATLAITLTGVALATGARWSSIAPAAGAAVIGSVAVSAGLLAFLLAFGTAVTALVAAVVTARGARGFSVAMVSLLVTCLGAFWLATRFIAGGDTEI